MSQVNQAVSNISLPGVSLSDEQKSAIKNQAAANAQVLSTGAEAKAALIAAGKDASQNEAAGYISQLRTGMDQLIAGAAARTATQTADTVASQASEGTVDVICGIENRRIKN